MGLGLGHGPLASWWGGVPYTRLHMGGGGGEGRIKGLGVCHSGCVLDEEFVFTVGEVMWPSRLEVWGPRMAPRVEALAGVGTGFKSRIVN